MNEIETRILIEETGNYDELDVEVILEIYKQLQKHIGWKDERRDNRYIVKFHDIFYYMPDEWYEKHIQNYDNLFESFCEYTMDIVDEEEKENDIDSVWLLASRPVGSYRAYKIDMPEITEENILELAMDFYDEYNYEGGEYVEQQIKDVEILYDLEKNYMEYWFDFLQEGDFPKEILTEMREKYNKDKKGEK